MSSINLSLLAGMYSLSDWFVIARTEYSSYENVGKQGSAGAFQPHSCEWGLDTGILPAIYKFRVF